LHEQSCRAASFPFDFFDFFDFQTPNQNALLLGKIGTFASKLDYSRKFASLEYSKPSTARIPEKGEPMPTPALHQIVLTVSNSERSRAFYADLLGFEVTVMQEGGFYFANGSVLTFVIPSPKPLPGDRFSEFRIGLDHLSFTCSTRAELDAIAAKLQAAGVDTKGVEQFAPTGNYYIAFRDPDNMQLEYWLEKS
jgi:catechol 2,3-dioxygenase-like lactoylglutathione lyase family enzyme